MCGLVGRVSVRGAIDQAALAGAVGALAHRGPDGSGVYAPPPAGDAAVALGHTRLAIVDLAGGMQPMASADGRLQVVFNGEIYNHADLRAALTARGHRFRTRCDTEVLLVGYDEWGDELMPRLRGMFAFALWDGRARRLLLARDRVGIKPLYYAELSGGDLAFASDLSALFAFPDLPRDLDSEAAALYLALRYVPAPRTVLSAVNKLLPGHRLIWQAGKSEVAEFWDFPIPPAEAPLVTEAESAYELRARLDESVARHLMADVPLGVFLSGGLDSTAVAAAMTRLLPRVRTFAVGFASPESELAWARLAARARK
jgi:asparagine synthase (glutamine-hydrolysing)